MRTKKKCIPGSKKVALAELLNEEGGGRNDKKNNQDFAFSGGSFVNPWKFKRRCSGSAEDRSLVSHDGYPRQAWD